MKKITEVYGGLGQEIEGRSFRCYNFKKITPSLPFLMKVNTNIDIQQKLNCFSLNETEDYFF